MGAHLSPVYEVVPEWLDYNGHMNMAYYSVLFDRASDAFYPEIGVGAEYAKTRRLSTFTADFHISYVRELKLGDRVRVKSWILGHDAKRLHSYQEAWHEEGWLAASAEAMTLHVDLTGPKVAPWPEDVAAKLAAFAARHAPEGTPARAGRKLALPKRIG
ncbi:MAG: thioesterase [Rhodobacterales bacterium]|nr:MAG: thioesterase [Rhodobacterales bacterium]